MRRLLDGRDIARDRRPDAGNEQSVRVHAIRGAGHQRDPVLALHDFQPRGVVGFNDLDPVDPVAQRLAHHVDVEVIADLHLIESGEHHGFHQASMPGDHRVGRLAADRQARPVQVPRARGQRRLRGAVVDRQVHRDLRDTNRSHHAAAGIQQRLVFLVLRGCGVLAGGARAARFGGERVVRLAQDRLARRGEPLVVGVGGGQRFLGLRVWPARHTFRRGRRGVRQPHVRLVLQHHRVSDDA